MTKYKILPERLQSQSNNILNKDERLATNTVESHPTSTFDKSSRHLTTFDSGKLVPIYVDEVLPGDIFSINPTTLIRLATPSAATMESPVYDIFFFFVPNRIIWENWKYFMGENKEAGFQKNYKKVPLINYDTEFKYTENDLASYLGIPVNVDMSKINVPLSSLYFKAYGKIWNDFFRDQNIMSEIDIFNNNNVDSNVTVSDYKDSDDYNKTIQIGKGLAPVTRLPDYFSTCLPYPQKGDSVSLDTLPLNNLTVDIPKLNITSERNLITPSDVQQQKLRLFKRDGGQFKVSGNNNSSNILVNNIGANDNTGVIGASANADQHTQSTVSEFAYTAYSVIPKNGVPVNVQDGHAYSVNDLRLSLAIQHMRELDARSGTRYIEYLLSHFGISVSNARLDRAEQIGGFRSNINISNVVQTSAGSSGSPLGVLGGVSVTSDNVPDLVEYASDEHGIIMGFVVVRPQINYSQGLEKKFTRCEKLDFYDPLLANIGEQPVKKYELFLDGSDSNENNEIFGFNEAWADYRYSFNKLSGYVSVNSDYSLSTLYSYTEKYENAPVLGEKWMYPNSSVIGSTLLLNNDKTEYIHQFLGDFYFHATVTRRLPVYSIPGLSKI